MLDILVDAIGNDISLAIQLFLNQFRTHKI